MRLWGAAVVFVIAGACSQYGESGATAGASDAGGDSGASDATTLADASSDSDANATANRYAEAVLADAPLLYMHFAEDGGLTAHARIGTGGTYSPTGIAFGAPGAIDGGDPAITFTDGNGAITMPEGLDFEDAAPFTVEAWIKLQAQKPAGTGFIVDHELHAPPRRGWVLRAGEDLGFERWGGGANDSIAAAAPLREQWHHVVGVFDGANMRLYVDTARVGERSAAVSLPKTASTWAIGHQSCCGATNSYAGDLDELAVYGSALPEPRIVAHYAAR